LGFPTGWSFTTHQANFLAPLPGIEEEEAPTSTTRSHVNLAPAAIIFWRRCRGRVEDFCGGSFSHAHPLLCYCFALLYLFYLHRFISKTKKIRILGSCYFFTLVHHAVP
jgi:hypothetical protein